MNFQKKYSMFIYFKSSKLCIEFRIFCSFIILSLSHLPLIFFRFFQCFLNQFIKKKLEFKLFIFMFVQILCIHLCFLIHLLIVFFFVSFYSLFVYNLSITLFKTALSTLSSLHFTSLVLMMPFT